VFSLTIKLIVKVFLLEHTIDTIVFQDNFARIEESFLWDGASLQAYLFLFWDWMLLGTVMHSLGVYVLFWLKLCCQENLLAKSIGSRKETGVEKGMSFPSGVS